MSNEYNYEIPHNQAIIPSLGRSQMLLIGAEHDIHYPKTHDLIPKHIVEKLEFIRNEYPNVAYRGNDIAEVMKNLYPSNGNLASSRSNQVRAYQNSFVTSFSILMRMHELSEVAFPCDAPMQSLYGHEYGHYQGMNELSIQPWYMHSSLIEPDLKSQLSRLTYPFRIGYALDQSIPVFYKEHQDYCDAVDIWAAAAVPTYLEKNSPMHLLVAAGQLEAYCTVQDLHLYSNRNK